MLSAKEIKKIHKKELAQCIEWFGSAVRLADAVGVSKSAVSQWVKRGKISATAAIDVERVTSGEITKEQLRPDVREWQK